MAGSLNDLPLEFGSDQLQAEGANNSFIARIFTDGSFQWGFALPELYSFNVVTENIIHACGKFSGTVAFGDTTLTSTTATADVYHARILYGPDLPNSLTLINRADATVYPNPFIDYINLQCEGEIRAIHVIDIAGRIVETFGNITQLSLQHLKPGNYILQVITNEGVVKKHIVKY